MNREHRVRRVAAGALLLLGALSVRADEGDFGHLMGLLAQRTHARARFIETHYLALLDRPIDSSGELLYDAPDYLQRRTLKPSIETVTFEHGLVSVQRGKRQMSLNAAAYPQVLPLIESIRATLAGDGAALQRLFDVSFNGSLDQWQLQLVPKDPQLLRVVSRVRIAGALEQLQEVEVTQPDGDHSIMHITPLGAP